MGEIGKYPNSPAEFHEQKAEARTQTTYEVGDYLLRLHRQFKLYVPERKDRKPVPPALAGNWTSPQDFALKVDAFDKIRRKGDSDAA